MPQIADLEIAATWDEIELEAALRGHSAEAPGEPRAETPSCLADALRAVEALKQLPKEERKRRAEELLRALTSAPTALPPEADAAPQPTALVAVPESSSDEDIAVAAELSASPSAEPASDESVAAPREISESTPAEASSPEAESAAPLEAAAESLLTAEAIAASSEISQSTPEAASIPEVFAAPAEAPVESPEGVEPVAASAEISLSKPEEAPRPEALAAPVESSIEAAESVEPVTATPVPESIAVEVPSCAIDAAALVIDEPALDAAGASGPVAEPAVEAAPEQPSTPPALAPEPDAIPKFLTTECTALEAEQPDSLIPFRTVAAAGALLGAVLLVYFWSSQEFGVAARPIIGSAEMAPAHALAPRTSASLAARQAFVAPPPDFGAGPQPVRPHRPALVGFDLFDDPAPTPMIAVKTDAAPTSAQATPVAPQPSAEETAALPPSSGSDVAALIKRGDDLLKAGDVAAARSAYERAAASGNAKAQIGVGQTYDPLVLAKLGARGVRADPVQAASWYARAGEAGDEEGQQRLHALISGLSDCMLAQGSCTSRKP